MHLPYDRVMSFAFARRVTQAIAGASLIAALAVSGLAQTDISKLGPQVGGKAIDFQLTDQFGRQQTLETLAGPKGTMLVFIRSADW
jgi:cytochrome oxidase Cu insertion factor (SCO1/SenC/PrrC family)